MTRTLADEAAAAAQSAPNVALCLDFDGTLAPVVENPDHARLLPGMLDVLGALAARFAAVALVSGRPAAYLAEHASTPGVRYLGLYGLQETRGGRIWVDPRLRAARPAVVAASEDLRAAEVITTSGAFLEDKEYAVAVHTRRLEDPQRWAQPIDRVVRAIAARWALEVIEGRLVWELRPAVKGDKGDAVRRVVADSGARSVVVIGDDLGDLPAFAAARSLAAEGGGTALLLAVRSAESPPQLLVEADAIVDGPAGVRDFLQLLLAPNPTDGDTPPQRSTR